MIHARAFRRLAGKTQVFTHGYSDHYRSRLTHTMEVAQLARTIAAALGLNGDLTESLALVHDIGHPPFGHAGRARTGRGHARAWPALRPQSARAPHRHCFRAALCAFPGLNLTLGVREGIIKHSRDYDPGRTSGACGVLSLISSRRSKRSSSTWPMRSPISRRISMMASLQASSISAHVRAHVALFERFYAPMALEYPAAATGAADR